MIPPSCCPAKTSSGRGCTGPTCCPPLLAFLVRNQDKLPFHKLVSHKFPLAEVNEAFAQAEWSQRQTEITRAMLVP